MPPAAQAEVVSAPRSDRPAPAWSNAAWGAVLVLLVVAVYWPTLANGFIWDDDLYVVDNVPLRTLAGLRDIWLKFTSEPQYYPLVHTTFWVEYQLWGADPRGYHAVNMALHAAAVLLVWRARSAARAGGLAGGGDLRRAPHRSRERGLGDRAEERAVVRAGARIDPGVLCACWGLTERVSPTATRPSRAKIRPHSEAGATVRACAVCGGGAQQIGDG